MRRELIQFARVDPARQPEKTTESGVDDPFGQGHSGSLLHHQGTAEAEWETSAGVSG